MISSTNLYSFAIRYLYKPTEGSEETTKNKWIKSKTSPVRGKTHWPQKSQMKVCQMNCTNKMIALDTKNKQNSIYKKNYKFSTPDSSGNSAPQIPLQTHTYQYQHHFSYSTPKICIKPTLFQTPSINHKLLPAVPPKWQLRKLSAEQKTY